MVHYSCRQTNALLADSFHFLTICSIMMKFGKVKPALE
jgi:hypothetical protein